MQEAPPNEPPDDPYHAIDPIDPGKPLWFWPLIIGAAFVSAIGAIPALMGFGPFAFRLLTSDEVPIHVLNLSGYDVQVTPSFSGPVDAPAGGVTTMESLEGPIRLRTVEPAEGLVEEIEVDAQGEVFYVVGGGQCLVVLDITPLYEGEGGDPTVVARIFEEDRVYVFTSDVVLLPRRTPPDQVRGRIHWIEPIGCAFLTPEEEPYLIARQLLRLEQRREQYEEALEEARQANP